jgi:cobyric acid synthase
VFEQLEDVTVRYVRSVSELDQPDIIMIPGSKNTIRDLRWLKETGLAAAIQQEASKGTILFGICGGFQMLGSRIEDPEGVECGGSEEGLGLLRVHTVLGREKKRTVFEGSIVHASGVLSRLAGKSVQGYEIHMGSTYPDGEVYEFTSGQTGYCQDNIYGSYVHGMFDTADIMTALIEAACQVADKKADTGRAVDYAAFKEQQYERLAQALRESLDMDYIYRIMGLERHDT